MKFSNVSLLFLAAGTTISARDFNPRRRPLGRKMNRKSLRTQRAASLHPRQAEEAAACMKSCAESDPSYGDKIIGFEHDVEALQEEARNLEGVTEEDMQKVAEGLMADHGLSMDTLKKVGMNCAESCGVPPPHGPPERAAVFDDRNAKGAKGVEGPSVGGVVPAMMKTASMMGEENFNCFKTCAEGKNPIVQEIEDTIEHGMMEGSRYLETLETVEEDVEAKMEEAGVTKDDLKQIAMDCIEECKVDE